MIENTTKYKIHLFFISFLSLFLELMIIRWVPASIRLVAYYANLMLISSFLGIGFGALLKKKNLNLFRFFPYILLLDLVFLVISHEITLGGFSELRFFAVPQNFINVSMLVCIFLLNVFVFVPIGEKIGELFDSLPPLSAYTWDLSGSLMGTITFGVFSYLFFSPLLGFLLVFIIYLVLSLHNLKWYVFLSFVFGFICIFFSIPAQSLWSPYYFITISEVGKPKLISLKKTPSNQKDIFNPPRYSVRVNQDFYQYHEVVDPNRYSVSNKNYDEIVQTFFQYTVPYPLMVKNPETVLVIGSGGGKEAEVAIMKGAKRVDAVEVDPVLINISKKLNPSRIYYHPNVKVIINDARAFVSSTKNKYDAVIFGYLDSQALFSAQSNIRLDGYVYTTECFRDAYELLTENGVLSISFGCPEWLRNKLIRMIFDATGKLPIVYTKRFSSHFLIWKGNINNPPPHHGNYNRIMLSNRIDQIAKEQSATDDWPYLYLKGKHIPFDYLLLISILIVLSVILLKVSDQIKWGEKQLHFFFLGAAFLLLQTKSITDCSLYFGATWLVTTIVVAGVLIMVLTANIIASKMTSFSKLLYLPLIISLLIQYVIPRGLILQFDFWGRVMWVLFLVPLPIFFAGLIFSTTFRDSENPSSCIGANLIGATIGGFLEYLSMLIGLKQLLLLIMVLYLLSNFIMVKREKKLLSL